MKTRIGAVSFVLAVGFLATPLHAEISSLPKNVATEIAAMGPNLNPDIITKSFALMRPLVPAPPASVKITRDVSYGDDPLQKLDIYQPNKGRNLPIAIYVHGGGFVRGDKSDYNNVVAYFAEHGVVGVNANYRLAPKVTWPAESQDVGAVVAFVQKNAAQYGGDPKRIVIIGHSAGANLVASYVLDPSLHPKSGPGVTGAVLISGPAYRAASLSKADQIYFGEDAGQFEKRVPGTYLKDSKTPLLIVTAELDPISLAPESYDLAARACVRDGQCPRFLFLKGHNHISEVVSVGSKDDQLAKALLDFATTKR